MSQPTPLDDSATATHCPCCALQCAMTLAGGDGTPAATSQDRELTVLPREFPTNRGGLCRKGWTSAELLDHPDRIIEPLARQADGGFAPIGWDEAYDRWVAAIRRTREAYGPDAVGAFGGASLTNEKACQLGKFVRIALGSSRVDYNGRFCMSSAAAAGNRSLGLDRGMPFPVTDLDDAHTVLLIGSNPADTMPPFVPHLAAARAAGGLVVIDPRRSATAALTAEGAGGTPAADAGHRPRAAAVLGVRPGGRAPGRPRLPGGPYGRPRRAAPHAQRLVARTRRRGDRRPGAPDP